MKCTESSVLLSNETNTSNWQFFVEKLQQQPLSVICYILWYLYNQRETTDLAFTVDPLRYIFRFDNKYTLFGNDIWELEDRIRWYKTNNVLFFEEERWEEVIQRFENLRSLENNRPAESYNTYLTLSLSKEHLSIPESVDNRIVQFPSSKYPLPKRYRSLVGGLAFGLLKNEKIVSFASAPHILTHKSFSFAILRGIETKLLERKQGYALKTVGVLCQELFSQYQLKKIFSWVEEKNTAARSLYKNLGFREKAKTFAIYCDRKQGN